MITDLDGNINFINTLIHFYKMNFKILKSKGFRDKFEKNRVYYKRKILRMEYKSILVAISILLRSLKLDILKANT